MEEKLSSYKGYTSTVQVHNSSTGMLLIKNPQQETKQPKQAKHQNETTQTTKTKRPKQVKPPKQMKGFDNKYRDITKKVGIFHISNGILAKTCKKSCFQKKLPSHIMDY